MLSYKYVAQIMELLSKCGVNHMLSMRIKYNTYTLASLSDYGEYNVIRVARE